MRKKRRASLRPLVRAVLLRVRDVARRRDRDVDGCEGREAKARLGIGVHDDPGSHVATYGLDQARRELRERGRGGLLPVEEAAAEHGCEEGRGGERGADLQRRPAADEAEDERGDASDDREPGDPGGRRVPQDVVEVARVDDLEEHPGSERERDQERPCEAHEHSHASGEGEREREESGRPSSLRDRDEVGEGGEEERHQHHREHRERSHRRRMRPSGGAPRSRPPGRGAAPRSRPRRRG